MKKRPLAAVLDAVTNSVGDHVIKDTTLGQWGIKKTAAGNELLLGMYPLSGLKTIETFPVVAENQQVVLLGASATKEVIAASTRYKIEIGNPLDKYESHQRFPIVHAYTTAAALSGNADTDRLNVYTALVGKVNSYAGNNASAYTLDEFDFTLGGATGNDDLAVGTQITQATSTATATVAKISISSGTFAGGDAAGTIWVYQGAADSGTIADAAYTWSWATSTLTQTNSTLVPATGMAVVDDADYFVSSIGRNGKNTVLATQGFSVAQFEIAEEAVYSEGNGAHMAAQAVQYDVSKQDAQVGSLDFELVDKASFDTTKTYKKYVFRFVDGDENALSGEKEAAESLVYLFADNGDTLTQLETDIAALLT